MAKDIHCELCQEDVERKIKAFVETMPSDTVDVLFDKVKNRCHWCPMDVLGTICHHSTDQHIKAELETLMAQIRSGDVHVDTKHDYWAVLYLALEDRVHARFSLVDLICRFWRRCLAILLW